MQDIRVVAGSSTPLPFLLVDSSDHTSPVIGANPTILISQNSGAFASPHTGVQEVGNGWYELIGGVPTTGVVGPLLLHATATGADPVDARFEVVPFPGANQLIANSGRYPLTFLMVSSTDHITGVPSLSPTVTRSFVGGPFATPSGTVREIGGIGNGLGWYYVNPDSRDTANPGPLLLHATAAGCDKTDERYFVAGLYGSGQRRLGPALIAIKGLLVNSGLFTNSSCIVSAAREPFPSPSPPCCAIAPGRFNSDGGLLTGGGRYETEIEGEFTIKLILRHTKDIATQDYYLYTSLGDGGYSLIEQIIDTLEEQFLYDPDGIDLTTCGLKLGSIGDVQPYGRDPMMGIIPVTFRTRVLLNLTVPDPS